VDAGVLVVGRGWGDGNSRSWPDLLGKDEALGFKSEKLPSSSGLVDAGGSVEEPRKLNAATKAANTNRMQPASRHRVRNLESVFIC